MRYLITRPNAKPFLSNWFDSVNHFDADLGMIVFDLASNTYTTNGKEWHDIKEDHF